MFVRPASSSDHKLISLHGKSIEVIRLPKYMHQDNTDRFSVAIVLVHEMSIPPSSFHVSPYSNSFQAFGPKNATQEERDKIKDEYWNSFTVLYEKEFGKDEISSIEEPFKPILNKLWDAIKNKDPYFDFNEHADTP